MEFLQGLARSLRSARTVELPSGNIIYKGSVYFQPWLEITTRLLPSSKPLKTNCCVWSCKDFQVCPLEKGVICHSGPSPI